MHVAPVLLPLVRTRTQELVAWALCDPADAEDLRRTNWRLHPRGYAVGSIDGVEYLMHRYLLGLKAGDKREADHINRNKLDNRRSNLRIATHAENLQNHPGFRDHMPRNVYARPNGTYDVKVRVGGPPTHVGTYPTLEAAAKAAEAFRLAHLPGAMPMLDEAA